MKAFEKKIVGLMSLFLVISLVVPNMGWAKTQTTSTPDQRNVPVIPVGRNVPPTPKPVTSSKAPVISSTSPPSPLSLALRTSTPPALRPVVPPASRQAPPVPAGQSSPPIPTTSSTTSDPQFAYSPFPVAIFDSNSRLPNTNFLNRNILMLEGSVNRFNPDTDTIRVVVSKGAKDLFHIDINKNNASASNPYILITLSSTPGGAVTGWSTL